VTAVQSSDLAAVDFDDWSGTLTIEFHSGGVYEYYNVPYSEYDSLMNASSHGKYFHAYIKNRFSCRRIQ
jgi:hypothetical protein